MRAQIVFKWHHLIILNIMFPFMQTSNLKLGSFKSSPYVFIAQVKQVGCDPMIRNQWGQPGSSWCHVGWILCVTVETSKGWSSWITSRFRFLLHPKLKWSACFWATSNLFVDFFILYIYSLGSWTEFVLNNRDMSNCWNNQPATSCTWHLFSP